MSDRDTSTLAAAARKMLRVLDLCAEVIGEHVEADAIGVSSQEEAAKAWPVRTETLQAIREAVEAGVAALAGENPSNIAEQAKGYLIRNCLLPYAPNVTPLDDLLGVCAQVDNTMTMIRDARSAHADACRIAWFYAHAWNDSAEPAQPDEDLFNDQGTRAFGWLERHAPDYDPKADDEEYSDIKERRETDII